MGESNLNSGEDAEDREESRFIAYLLCAVFIAIGIFSAYVIALFGLTVAVG